MSSIVLMGIKHCGKSTQGKLLSKKLNLPFYDTDSVIEEMNGLSCRQIYSQQGAEAFMQKEAQACAYVMEQVAKENRDAVIATGGGICNNKAALEILHTKSQFIFLETPEKLAADRIVNEIQKGPDGKMTNLPAYIAKKNPQTKADVRGIFHDFYTERVKLYSQLADVTVKMTAESVETNLDHILCSI